ncbi:hypothetical protein [Rugamonas apoptosis]|uniref:Uncharacterized protein n=1 Tax=Rugamonas apoptosis TaxID=2758570 RepID=A0A7W2F731_9BURK|nr:hypothetical protein [Rugamonas apoptosis]MBA5686332.1 hypothetical protein [Rugamonas apoptosis]
MKTSQSTLEAEIRSKLQAGEAFRLWGATAEITCEWRMGECHSNVEIWVSRNPGHKAVLGWAIIANCVAVLHSVVDTGLEILDITPRLPADMQRGLWFVREPRPRQGLLNILNVIEDWPVPTAEQDERAN